MWGQGDLSEEEVEELGIIPTRVGTSPHPVQRCKARRDHPHACGDKKTTHADTRTDDGSSPRVWGQVFLPPYFTPFHRIIPTRVGTRDIGSTMRYEMRDHPHACGDKAFETVGQWKLVGSSPRVWGQGFSFCHVSSSLRIIPTRVGTSIYHRKLMICVWDHPHACGDKSATH